MAKSKMTNKQAAIHEAIHGKRKIDQHEPHKNQDQVGCSEWVTSFCSTSGYRRDTNII